MSNNYLPNIISLGGSRCGSTSIYHILSEQNGIFGGKKKETNYFTVHHNDIEPTSFYEENFSGRADSDLLFESCPSYFHDKDAPQRIKKIISNPKIIVQIRNPAKRTISLFKHHYKYHKYQNINKYIKVGLDKAEKRAVAEKFYAPHHNIYQGEYYDALSRYISMFGCENVLVSTLDEMVYDSEALSDRLSNFLKIKINIPISKNNRPLRVNNSNPIKGSGSLHPDLRERLNLFYKKDLERTSILLGREITGLKA